MIVNAASTPYAIYDVGTCVHCGGNIERRRLIGWLHVDAFYCCKLPRKDGDPFIVAEPT